MIDDFAAQYRSLRIREGWARADGLEAPAAGDPRLWSGRIRSVSRAARVLSELSRPDRHPVVLDVGAGGAWVAEMLPWATVVAIDIIPFGSRSSLFVQADMRHLPLRTGSADGVLFAASLHYAHPTEVIPEVARVLRPSGLMVVVDSPMYPDSTAQAAAIARSENYYRISGFPALASNYHPINAVELRRALGDAGLKVERWRPRPSFPDRLMRLFGSPFTSMVVARLT